MPDFNVIIERVNSAILSRDYGFAEKLLNSCLKKTDGTPPEHLLSLKKLLGKLYIRSGNSEKGLTLYKELSAEHPRDTEILNDLGVIYRKLNLLDKSASILEEARTLNRDEADTLYNLGKTYQQSGNYEKAVGCFSRVLEINPEDVLAYNHLGTLNLVYKEYDKAAEIYKTGLRIDPNNPLLHFNLAEVFRMQGRYEEAEQSYRAALKAKPHWIAALTAITDCLVKRGEVQKAAETYKTIVGTEQGSRSEVDVTKLADLCLSHGDNEAARHYYTKALQLNRYFLPALSSLSNMLKSQEKYEEAYAVLSSGKEKNMDNKAFLSDLAGLCLMLQKQSEAEHILTVLTGKWPKDFDTAKVRGQFFLAHGETEKAEAIFVKLLQARPEQIDIRLECAKLCRQIGNLPEAAAQLVKYLEKRPQDIFARLKLGKLYTEAGRTDAARAEYEKIIKLDAKNIEAITAVAELNKDAGNTVETVRLVNKIIDMQANNGPEAADKDSLANSIRLYEDAVKNYESSPVIDQNLERLAVPDEGFDLTPQRTDESKPTAKSEKKGSIPFDGGEEFADREIPFNDLINLSDTEIHRSEQIKKMEDLVSFDVPLDDSPEQETGDEINFLPGNYGKPNKDRIQEEEFRLPVPPDPTAKKDTKAQDVRVTVDEQYSIHQYDPAIPMEEESKTLPDLSYYDTVKKDEEPLSEHDTAPEMPQNFSETDDPIPHDDSLKTADVADKLTEEADSLNSMMGELADKINTWLDDRKEDSGTAETESFPFSEREGEPPIDEDASDELIRLFSYLRDMMDNLPPEESKSFLIADEHNQMDYLIDKLSDDLGLKNRMIFMNIKNTLEKTMEPKNITEETLKDMLEYLRIIASQLPDKDFISAFIHKINGIIIQIKRPAYKAVKRAVSTNVL